MVRPMASVFIVIPTYNERRTVGELIVRIFALGITDLKVIVVDDHSPDGTAGIVRSLSGIYPVHLICRPSKNGLGTAYSDAFRQILSGKIRDWGLPDYVIQMDADFSHDPAVIPELLREIGRCDVVIGSRYVAGGSTVNWGLPRRALSAFANRYARTTLGLPYRDLTSGFKCYRRPVLESFVAFPLSSIGYNFQIETLYRAHRDHFYIHEIPITFTDRRAGESKMNFGIMAESFWKVLALRFIPILGRFADRLPEGEKNKKG